MPVVVGWPSLLSAALGRPGGGPWSGPEEGLGPAAVLARSPICWLRRGPDETVAWIIERDVGTGGLVRMQPLVADLAHFRQGASPELTHLILDRLYARWLLEISGAPKDRAPL